MGKKNTLAPGFRFHPTDLELVLYYLKRKILGKKFSFKAPIAEVDIYKYAPWDLPDMSCLKTGDLKWYFFCPIEKKYGKGGRLNRATIHGYWKTTGKDKPVEHKGEVVGTRKTLVFHRGKAPKGERTDWVMHEYKLEENLLADTGNVQDTYMLSVVFEKDGLGPRNGSQYGAPFKEEDWSDDEEETIVPGTGSLRGMPTVAVGGASSSIFPDSLCVAPPVESVDHSNASTVAIGVAGSSLINASTVAIGVAGSSLVPDGLCVFPSVDSLGHTNAPTVAVVGASSALFPDNICAGPSIESVGHATSSALAVGGASSTLFPGSLCVGPSAQSVGLTNACAASTLVEAPEVPVVADATIPTLLEAGRDQESNINILSMLDNFTEEEPFQSYLEDDDVAAMLESFTEVDDPNNYSFTF